MSKIDTNKWKEFVISDLFHIKRPIARSQTNYSEGSVPFVASGNFNNGVLKYLAPKENEQLDEGNCITVSPIDGSCFYQEKDFLGRGGAGSSIILLYNDKMNLYSGYFIATIIRAVCQKYIYSDMANKNIIASEKIKLPVDINGNPNFVYMEKYMQNLESVLSSSLTALRSTKSSKTCEKIDIQKWKQFRVEDIFPEIIKPEVYHTRQLIQDDNGIPYVVRSKFNNGIKYRVKKPVGKINPPNVISFGAENATFFYQQEEWVSGRDMYYIEVGDLPFYTCCFLTSIFQILAKKYSYNNGLFPEKLKKEKIMLPINNENGEIDYTYMEKFMKKKFFECKECLTSIVAV